MKTIEGLKKILKYFFSLISTQISMKSVFAYLKIEFSKIKMKSISCYLPLFQFFLNLIKFRIVLKVFFDF